MKEEEEEEEEEDGKSIERRRKERGGDKGRGEEMMRIERYVSSTFHFTDICMQTQRYCII
jgi:hypothetical protein